MTGIVNVVNNVNPVSSASIPSNSHLIRRPRTPHHTA
jgi:hypothetical protein